MDIVKSYYGYIEDGSPNGETWEDFFTALGVPIEEWKRLKEFILSQIDRLL